MPRDPFEFDDYFIQDYVATTEKVEFVVNDFNSLQAVFTNRYDQPVEGSDGVLRDSRPEFYTVGNEELWVPIHGATQFEHASGDPDKRIKSNTGYGTFINAALDVVGKDFLIARMDKEAPGGGLYDAALWTGLRWHWVTTGAGKKWENKRTGESGTSKGHQLPVEYLPIDGSGPTQAPLVEYDVDSLGLPESDLRDLMTYASGLPISEFQSRGISVARELQDDEVRVKLQSALSDPSFYETLRLTT